MREIERVKEEWNDREVTNSVEKIVVKIAFSSGLIVFVYPC